MSYLWIQDGEATQVKDYDDQMLEIIECGDAQMFRMNELRFEEACVTSEEVEAEQDDPEEEPEFELKFKLTWKRV